MGWRARWWFADVAVLSGTSWEDKGEGNVGRVERVETLVFGGGAGGFDGISEMCLEDGG